MLHSATDIDLDRGPVQVDRETVDRRFRCWQKAVVRSFDLEDFERQ